MDKFSNIKPAPKADIAFDNEYIKVINYEDWSFVSEKDMIICIPYLIEYNQFIVRQEYIPTFKYASGQEMYLTVLSGSIESGEKPEDCLKRELEEEAGIVLRDKFPIDFLNPLFVSKGNTAKYYCCILPLSENDYHETYAKTDGSASEKRSKCVKVNTKYINQIISTDCITELMIMKLKNYLNI